MPKEKYIRDSKPNRAEPLELQLQRDSERKFASPVKKREKKMNGEIDSLRHTRGTEKILNIAREQLEEEKQGKPKDLVKESFDSEDSDLELESVVEESERDYLASDPVKELGLTNDDEKALEMFMSEKHTQRRTLGDIIMEKMKEKSQKEDVSSQASTSNGISPQMVEVYTSIGTILSRYRSGKVPKAFKIIPALKNWEDVLFLTRPDKWSPQSMMVATRLFASNLNAKMAQRYYALILLPAVRQDIRANKRLNYHLYMSLKKALYKPAAFFKGILLPLCETGCTLREGAIISSVLAKVSIPILHSAAAMLKICQMPYNGASSLFLKVLMNKGYNLPFRVIDALLKHFLSFKAETVRLPVLWHQCLLVFAQRYKNALTAEQKDALKPLLRIQNHHQISPEIRRELFYVQPS